MRDPHSVRRSSFECRASGATILSRLSPYTLRQSVPLFYISRKLPIRRPWPHIVLLRLTRNIHSKFSALVLFCLNCCCQKEEAKRTRDVSSVRQFTRPSLHFIRLNYHENKRVVPWHFFFFSFFFFFSCRRPLLIDVSLFLFQRDAAEAESYRRETFSRSGVYNE